MRLPHVASPVVPDSLGPAAGREVAAMRWSVGTMLMLLFLLGAGCAPAGPDARTDAQTFGQDERARLVAAVDRALTDPQPYRFVLKVILGEDKPVSPVGNGDPARYFVGTVTGRDWTITGRLQSQTYHLVSRGGILTLRVNGRDVAVPPALHGLFSPRDHLSLVRRYLDRATPTHDMQTSGSAVPAMRVDVPPPAVAALVGRALGPAFHDRGVLEEVEGRARVTYILGVDPHRARVAALLVIVRFEDQPHPLQHVLEYRFLEG